jgi:hypothetical protein
VADEHEHDHDEDLEHSHEGEDADGEEEIEITIEPREEDIEALGVTIEQFEAALMKTLDTYEHAIDADDPEAVAPLEEAEIELGGKVVKLGEVADIAITGGLDGLGEDDDELDEEEPEEPE